MTASEQPRIPRSMPSAAVAAAPARSSFLRRIAGERAEERVYRVLAFGFLPGAILFGLLAVPPILSQRDLWPGWWTVAAFAIGVLPSVALGLGAFVVPLGVLRAIARVNVGGTLLILASVPFVVTPIRELSAPIWFATVSGLGLIAAALAADAWGAVLLAAAGAVLTLVDRLPLGDADGLVDGVQSALYIFLFTVTFVALGVSSLSAARAADVAEAAAEEATVGAAADAARERERSRINELVHDRVLATLLTAAREIPGSGGLERRDAQRALEGLQALLRDEVVLEELSAEEFVWKLQAVATELLPEALFNYDLDDSRDLPGEAVEALVDAAEEAMRNSRRHAGDANRTVHVRVHRDGAVVDVLDDGVGFERAAVPAGRLGLSDSIEGRMRALPGGSALVVSQPGVGTRVTVSWAP